QSLDLPAAEVSADMIGVVVRHEHTGEVEAVGGEDVEERADSIRGIDRDRLTAFAITDEVAVVGHRPGHRIVEREVGAGQQLTKVEPITHRASIHGGFSLAMRFPTGHQSSCAPGRYPV